MIFKKDEEGKSEKKINPFCSHCDNLNLEIEIMGSIVFCPHIKTLILADLEKSTRHG
jgi:hypothetical protein